MQLINLTQHVIRLVDDNDGIIEEIQPSGLVARVATAQEIVGSYMGRPIARTKFGEIENLPAPEEGKLFVTSSIVAQAAARKGRNDVVAPDTGPSAVRREGQVWGVRGFQTF